MISTTRRCCQVRVPDEAVQQAVHCTAILSQAVDKSRSVDVIKGQVLQEQLGSFLTGAAGLDGSRQQRGVNDG